METTSPSDTKGWTRELRHGGMGPSSSSGPFQNFKKSLARRPYDLVATSDDDQGPSKTGHRPPSLAGSPRVGRKARSSTLMSDGELPQSTRPLERQQSFHFSTAYLTTAVGATRVTKTALLMLVFLTSCYIFSYGEERHSSYRFALDSSTPLTKPIQTVARDMVVAHVNRMSSFGRSKVYETPKIVINLEEKGEDNVWYIVGRPWTVGLTNKMITYKHTWTMARPMDEAPLRFTIVTDFPKPFAVNLNVLQLGAIGNFDVVVASFILGFVYVLIVFDLVHRTMAAMYGSFMTIAALSILRERPSLETMVGWMHLETTTLLFGMMVMMGIFGESGCFEYFAIRAFTFSKGSVFKVYFILCISSAIVSAFLDNVTTILLVAPVSIQLCRVMKRPTEPLILSLVIFSNIGGSATLVGDPPNIIIGSELRDRGIGFLDFIVNLGPCVVVCMVAVSYFLKWYYQPFFGSEGQASDLELESLSPAPAGAQHTDSFSDDPEDQPSGNWEDTSKSTTTPSRAPGSAVENTSPLQHSRTVSASSRSEAVEGYTSNPSSHAQPLEEELRSLEEEFQIKDYGIFYACVTVLTIVVILFCVSSIVDLELHWIAIFGAVSLITLLDSRDIQEILEQVEWSTLLFFSCLSVIVHGVDDLRLIEFIGSATAEWIVGFDPDTRLLVAVLIILWVSAIGSAFIDNIPFTISMIPVVTQLADDPELLLPLRPMAWALALGCCLGGNGTLIGASANVVASGILEQAHNPVSFTSFFKVGMPAMIITIVISSVYVAFVYVFLGWGHGD